MPDLGKKMKIEDLTFMQAHSGNLCAKFHTFSFINNLEKLAVLSIGFSSFVVNLSLLASVILYMIFDLGLSIFVHSLKLI